MESECPRMDRARSNTLRPCLCRKQPGCSDRGWIPTSLINRIRALNQMAGTDKMPCGAQIDSGCNKSFDCSPITLVSVSIESFLRFSGLIFCFSLLLRRCGLWTLFAFYVGEFTIHHVFLTVEKLICLAWSAMHASVHSLEMVLSLRTATSCAVNGQ
jgi:hypothetical protein